MPNTSTDRFRRSWLGESIAGYLAGLAAQRYSKVTIEVYGRSLLRFSEFVERQGVRELERLPDWVDPFIAQLKFGRHWLIQWRCLLVRFIRHLREKGSIPVEVSQVESGPFAELLSDYAGFLAEHRGVSQGGISVIRSCCRAFLTHLDASGIADLARITPSTIHAFVALDGKHFTRHTMSGRCSALRGLLSYLHLRGHTPTDLSAIVVAPKLYAHERCPRFLTRSEVRAVLSSVDRRTPLGRRDYAILILLATYGLRGIEVLRVRLDDIDWRGEKLLIRTRKAGNETIYPLAPSVGRAILSYLERGRPQTAYRELFVTMKAPFRALLRTSAIGRTARKHFAMAGVQVERPGSHTLRYSCAQALLEKGTPLKTIGDYLGHRDPTSTQRYTMIAVDDLRSVAMGDGEDLL